MELTNIGGHKTINEFVESKLRKFNSMPRDFSSMFELMFSERENVLYEKSAGYKIEYTTYGEAYERIKVCAAGLRKAASEIETGSVVGLYMDNSVEWIISFWAILLAGFRPLLLNLRLSDEILERSMNEVGGRFILTDSKTIGSFPCVRFCDIPDDGVTDPASASFGGEVMVMSSGTTASPKICVYTAEEFYYQINDSYKIITECAQIKKHYDGELKLLTFLPFYHVFGLIAMYIWFSFFSRTFVHLGDFSPKTILNTIRRHKVTHIFAVPMFWNKVYDEAVKTIKARGEKTYRKALRGFSVAEKIGDVPVIGDLFTRTAFREIRENLFGDSICFMISGGSEIRTEVISFFNSIGYHLADGYGMTETGITSVELSSKRKILNSCSVGKPLSSVEYRISDGGELLVRGRSLAKYIYENGEKHERGDWFNTRDLAESRSGRYVILGRRDDIVISESGENLNPNLIEPLLDLGESADVCLIGASGESGRVPSLIVSVMRRTSPDELAELKEKLAGLMEKHGLSRQIRKTVFTRVPLILSDEFKLNRKRIAERFEKGEFIPFENEAGSGSPEAENEISEYVRGLFATVFSRPAEEFSPDSDFFLDEGGTSLDYFAMMSKIEDEFGVTLPSDADNSPSTIRELCQFIEGNSENVDKIR